MHKAPDKYHYKHDTCVGLYSVFVVVYLNQTGVYYPFTIRKKGLKEKNID